MSASNSGNGPGNNPFNHFPSGLSPWGITAGAPHDRPGEQDWTGSYLVTLLVYKAPVEDIRKVTPAGMSLDETLISNGDYPMVLSFGAIENARNRNFTFLGINYLEAFSAIPGIYLKDPEKGSVGPFLHPLRGYLNQLMPVVLGWVSGYPKVWSRVDFQRDSLHADHDAFLVNSLLTNKEVISARFELSPIYQVGSDNRRLQKIVSLLYPNIVGVSLFGNPIRTIFEFAWEEAVAWDIVSVKLDLDSNRFAPSLKGTTSWQQIAHDVWPPVRIKVPWRLLSTKSPYAIAPTRLIPAAQKPG